jgi:lipopolysaccharide/colanic/teichoic acid biosynthesis glycosyltransferase
MVCMTARASIEQPLTISSQTTSFNTTAADAMCRLLNVAVALVGILLTLPLMIVIGALVTITSPGPMLFRQVRIGINRRGCNDDAVGQPRRHDSGGCPFTMYKFRTMYVASAQAAGTDQVWAKREDSRVTPVGRILRKCRLDELPQLFNVLMGDMNVVGPRPEQPVIFETLREALPEYAERQRVLPGITGWAQVNRGYDESFDDVKKKLDLDLEYINHRSAGTDARIMMRTLPVMFGNRSNRGW